MRRPSAWLLTAWCLLEVAWASPCRQPGVPDALQRLSRDLSRATTDARRATLQHQAELHTEAGPPAARACAHALAGRAAFYRSNGADAARHAADAVRHFVVAESLAPAAMRANQRRVNEAWRRLGSLPWATGPARPVRISAAEPTTLQLRPEGPGPTLTLAVTDAAVITLPPGRWRVQRSHRCGPREISVTVTDQLVAPPPPACPVQVLAVDAGQPVAQVRVRGAGGPIALEALRADAGPVVIDAPGYTPVVGVPLPAAGGPLTVELARCPVDLRLRATPADAQTEGGGPGPWGRRRVRARRPGYAELNEAVLVPRPAGCEGARYDVPLHLARPVTVDAEGPGGRPITLGRLVVQGEPVSPAGFTRPPGEYTYQATHPQLGLHVERFEVRPCVDADGCPPAVLTVRYRGHRDLDRSRTGPVVTIAAGAALTLGGLVAGVQALSTQQAIDDYESKAVENRPIQALIDQRDLNANLANGLVGTGLVALTSGVVWYLLSEGG